MPGASILDASLALILWNSGHLKLALKSLESRSLRIGRRPWAAAILMCVCYTQVALAEDFAIVFTDDFQGIALDTSRLGKGLPNLPLSGISGDDVAVPPAALPGFPLTQEELMLVLRTTDPVGAQKKSANANSRQSSPATDSRPMRDRLVDWITQRSSVEQESVFSALARSDSEPGMRLDIDPNSDKVIVEYRIGF